MKKTLTILSLMLAVTFAASAFDAKRVMTIKKTDGTVHHYMLEAIHEVNFVYNTHEYVDLGLTSGNLWATCNLGASSPTDYGWYLSFGEADPKPSYNTAYYSWYNFHRGRMMQEGLIDWMFNALPEFDSAALIWGEDWRTPSRSDWQEVLDECTFTWTTIDGVNGDLVTGPNGNTIFLPAGGYYNNGTTVTGLGNSCEYRTQEYRYHFNAHNNHRFYEQAYDYFGMPVRAVKSPCPYIYPVKPQVINNDHRSNTITVAGYNINTLTATSDIPQAQVNVEDNNITVTFVTDPGSENLKATITVQAADSKGRTKSITYEVTQARKAPYKYIDLGLPSGTQWANCDLGADVPEGKGVALAFGELFPKTDYSNNNNLWYSGMSTADAVASGIVDGTYVLTTPFDAATAWISDDVSLPSREQCLELINSCRWKRTTLNGKAGFEVFGPNGNSIFIPGYGYYRGVNNIEIDQNQHMWTASRTATESVCFFRCDIRANNDVIVGSNQESYNGLHIRAVTKNAPSITAIEEQFIPMPEMSNIVTVSGNNIDHITASLSDPNAHATVSVNGMDVTTTFSGVVDDAVEVTVTGYSANGKETIAKYNVTLLPDEYKAIDLGLTSGRKWANRNVDAAQPGMIGGYYSFGMTNTLSNYAANNTAFGNMQYTGMQTLGAIDDQGNLTYKYDVAAQHIGSDWRVPTYEEMIELESECEWTMAMANGNKCFKVTGPNGKYILLPLGGYYNGANLVDFGSREQMWTAKAIPNTVQADYSNHHIFNYFSTYAGEKRWGFQVRAVYDSTPSIMPVYEQHVPSSTLQNVVEIEAVNTASIAVSSSNEDVTVSNSGFTVTTTFPVAGSEERTTDITVTATSATGETSTMTYTVKQLPGLQHEYVDLGLPSGLLWATCNIGSRTPYDRGGYFAWGETVEKPEYSVVGSSWQGITEQQMVNAGVVEGHLLTEKYDVATDRFGAPWRMPYFEEFQELIANCTWHLDVIDGIKYRRIVGRNGNSIILPEDGYMRNGALNSPEVAHYWSKSYSGHFRSNRATIETPNTSEFFLGMHVRPIRTDAPAITAISDIALTASALTCTLTPSLHNIDIETVTIVSDNASFACAFNPTDGTLQVSATSDLAHGAKAKLTLKGSKPGYNDAVTTFNALYFDPSVNHYVDLGLPSGSLWADRNLDAEYPNSTGDYVGYGDPGPLSSTAFSSPWRGIMSRTLKAYGVIDNNFNLVGDYDVFSQQVGEDWRMPTKDQVNELMSECEWTIVMLGNKKCWRVDGPSGKSIYFPISGYKNNGNRLTDNDVQCNIYSSTARDLSVGSHYSINRANECRMDSVSREFMYTVRGVYDRSPRMLPVLNQHVTSDSHRNTVTIAGDHIASIAASSSEPEVATVSVSGMDVTTNFIGLSAAGRKITVEVVATSLTGETAKMKYTVEQTPMFNPDYVDLGLPSGLLWASYNVGATKITDYGYSIAWGDVETRHFDGNNYSDTYTLFNGRPTSELLNNNIVSENGVANQGTLNPAFDAANLWWQDGWRMPTKAELQELIDNCSFTRIVIDGVYGHKVTNKQGDGSAWIFIPDAGYYRGASLRERGTNSHLWTSTCENNNSFYCRVYNGGTTLGASGERFLGMAIRPVREAPVEGIPVVDTIEDVVLDRQITGSTTITGSNIASIQATSSNPDMIELAVSGNTININVNTTRSVSANVDLLITSPQGRTVTRTFQIRYHNPEGVDYVDLGLPSGKLWASCNVGALQPEDNGEYFAFGEVQPKPWYNAASYEHNGKSIITMQAEGVLDGDNRLTANYDPATFYLGDGWRSPRLEDFAELHNNCNFSAVTLTSGARVTRITSRINGNYIDLPICGRKTDFTLEYLNTYGEYWAGTITTDRRPHWVSIAGTRYVEYPNNEEYFRGRAVRAVLDPNAAYQLATPANLATSYSEGAVTLTWNTVDGATSYTIHRSNNGEDFTQIGTSTTNSYVDNTALPGLNYYRVQAIGADDTASLMSSTSQPISTLWLQEHDYVDLGLPSGLKWATCDIGATSLAQYGDYYSWGENAPKETYTTGNYAHQGKQLAQLISEGVCDEAGNLLPEYDAATHNWGSAWRMPTTAEVHELFDNCTTQWMALGGIYGMKVTGPNGQSVFFPASGYKRNSGNITDLGTYTNNRTANWHWHWCFGNNRMELLNETSTYTGFPIRPVTDCAPGSLLRRPGNFKISTANEKVRLKWDAVPSATSYVVYRSADNINFSQMGTTTTNSFVDNSPLTSGSNYYRVQALGDGGAQSQVSQSTMPLLLTHESVDLGLPSGLRWATTNIGAVNPEDCGDYYIWGETETRPECTGDYSSLFTKKFDWMQGNGALDVAGNLTAKYDAASYTWGNVWRMPTQAEYQELIDNCTWEWTTVNDVRVAKVTGPNGNFIYLPAAGYRGNDVAQNTTISYYWSSTPGDDRYGYAYFLRFEGSRVELPQDRRFYGYPVRPVTEVGDDSALATPRNVRSKATDGKMTVTWDAVADAATYIIYHSTDGENFTQIGTASTNYYIDAEPDAGFNYYCVKAVGANYAQSEQSLASLPLAPHMEYVDLGLPSGVKWAKMNVGASTPAGFGDLFAWGDPTPNNGEESPWYNTQTRYLGEVIYQGHLAPAYDPATVNWGQMWYQPTSADYSELRYNCTWTIETVDGHKGYRVTGPNGNSIFLPFFGADESRSYDACCYWTSTPYGEAGKLSYSMDIREWSLTHELREDYRNYASPVRAVTLSADIEILAAPVDVMGIATGSDITVSWSEVQGATSYNIYRSTDGETYNLIGTARTNLFVDTPAAVGTYTYRVQAVSDESRSELSAPSAPVEMGLFNGHEYVDLGLPSGLVWAKSNMGADNAIDYGDVYAWGEVFTKSLNNAGNSAWYDKTYAELKAQGAIDAIGNLTAECDAAQVNWGGGWRMPSRKDILELINKCTWEWTTIDGVNGQLVTGPNGNTIFLPAAGSAHDSFGLHNNNGYYGYYWTSTAVNNNASAYDLYFANGTKTEYQWDRWRAQSIRPVVLIPDANTLPTPDDLSVAATDGYIELAWETVVCATSYKVFRSADGVNFTEIANPTANTFIDNSPIQGLNYYRVQAFGEDGIHSDFTAVSDPVDYLEYNGHEYVDLGLPSGLKWAKRNIGAYDISDWGNYYSWGEVATKDSYLESTGQWHNVSYAELAAQNVIDAIGNLCPDYDAAIANWGGGWHMPNATDMQELIDNCTFEWVTINDHGCVKVIGPSGKSIYLPAAGVANSNYAIGSNSNRYAHYWSSTVVNDMTNAKRISSGHQSANLGVGDNGRCWGYPVRPVFETTADNALPAIRGLKVAPTDGKITLTWVSVIGATSYKVFRSTDGTNFTEVETVTTNTYIDNSPANSLNYYRVQAFGDGGKQSEMTAATESVDYLEFNGHEYVDLGLPSGVMWAKRNVGAERPADVGGYYAWGETATKDSYLESTGLIYGKTHATMLSEGIIDANNTLTPAYDAAAVNWSNGWRMPTLAEMQELISQCSWEWVNVDGRNCRKATGPNGNSVYFPAGGAANNYAIGSNSNIYCLYWTSTASPSENNAKRLAAFESGQYIEDRVIWNGLSIRPVTEFISLDTPQNIATLATDSKITLTWDAVDGAASYAVFRSADNVTFEQVGTAETNSFTDSDVTTGTYYYRVQALASDEGRSRESESVSVAINTNKVINGHEYVDLGLPSGLRWATSYVGASDTQTGSYFYWGETTPSTSCSIELSPWSEKSAAELRSQGVIDDSGFLTPAHDAAIANWGGPWRTPSPAEFQELVDNCTFEWVNDGINGLKVTGPNGNSVFLGSVGYIDDAFNPNNPCFGAGLNIRTTDNEWEFGGDWGVEGTYQPWEALLRHNCYGYRGYVVLPVVDLTFGDGLPRPYNVVAKRVNNNVNIVWRPVEGATSYKVFRSTDGENFTEIMISTSNSCIDTQPEDGKLYYRVQAFDGDGAQSQLSVSSLPLNFRNEYDYVDLGLPSGNLWATCNMGASAPTVAGDFYAWGETVPKQYYLDDNYRWLNLSVDQLSDLGIVDQSGKLNSNYDAANVNMGGDWFMPTAADYNELCEYTSFRQAVIDGVTCVVFTSYKNGNELIIPYIGYMWGDRIKIKHMEYYTNLWLSNAFDDYGVGFTKYMSMYYNFQYDENVPSYRLGYDAERSHGCNIRPVKKSAR